MGETGCQRIRCLLGPARQGGAERGDSLGQTRRFGPEIKFQIIRRLIVARTPGTELRAEAAETLGQHAFDEGMDVLIEGFRLHSAGQNIRTQGLQGDRQCTRILHGKHAGCAQSFRMGDGARNIVRDKPGMLGRGTRKRHQRRTRRLPEAPAPETNGLVAQLTLPCAAPAFLAGD